MKKLGLISLLAIGVMLCAGTSFAVPYYDYKPADVWLNGTTGHKTATFVFNLDTDILFTNYTRHVLTDIGPEDIINSAELGISFTDDNDDVEYARIWVDSIVYANSREIDEEFWTGTVNWYLHNSDHLLTVVVEQRSGDFGIEYARVAGDFTNNRPASAVPEPATMSLLGLGLAGVGWLRRKK